MPHAIWKIYTLFNFSLSPDPRDSICQWGPTCLLESHSWPEHSVRLLALSFVPSLHRRWHHSGFSPPLLSQVLSSAQWGVSQHSTAVTVQFSSAAQSCSTLCDPVKHSTPGLPVHHQLPESTQTHVHWVGDAIQPSHPLSSPCPPALKLSQHQGLFKWVSSSHQVAKVLEFQLQHQSLQWTPRTDLLYNGLVGTPCSPRDSQESSPTPR